MLALAQAIDEYGQNGHFGRLILLKTFSAKDAKYGFGMLIDTARAEPVTVEKHGRPVVVVISVEEYARLLAIKANMAGENDLNDRGGNATHVQRSQEENEA
jgi:prevent-host-death family protein